MDKDPTRTAVRVQSRKRRLGPDASCAHCGFTTLECLRVLEAHHAAGKAHEPDLTVVLCRNCHEIYSEGQRREQVPLDPQPTLIETVIAALKGLAAFFRQLVDGFERLIAFLETTVLRLDESHPGWRLTCES